MAACFVCNSQDAISVNTQQLPRFKKNDKQAIAQQVAQNLKRIMQQFGSHQPTSIKLPSAMELAQFYQCTPLDVLDGLYAFKGPQYDYTMQGLDADIVLCGPLVCIKPEKAKPEWMYPWECTHKLTENPLTDVLANQREGKPCPKQPQK